MEKILDFQTREIPGEHARGNFRLLLSENETGINGLNAPIQLCGHGNTAGALFCGYQEKVEIKEEGRYRIADVQAVSGTILLDQKKCNRVFQKKAQTYMGITTMSQNMASKQSKTTQRQRHAKGSTDYSDPSIYQGVKESEDIE